MCPVAGTLWSEERAGLDSERGNVGLTRAAISALRGDSANEMGLHVFRLRVGRVVYIAPDVEVVLVRVYDFGLGDETAVLG